MTGPEFWFVLEGKMEATIGLVPTFVADQGDIIYAPATVWQQLRFAGTEMATRTCRRRLCVLARVSGDGGADSALPTAKAPAK